MGKGLVIGAVGVLGLAGCATTMRPVADAPDPRLEAALAGMQQDGPARDCLPLHSTRDIQRYKTALVAREGRVWWVNDMERSCRLDRDDVMVQRVWGAGQVCRGDIVRLVDRAAGMLSGSCAYGQWVPYRRADASPR